MIRTTQPLNLWRKYSLWMLCRAMDACPGSDLSLSWRKVIAYASPIRMPWSPSERKCTPAMLRASATFEANLLSSPTMVMLPASATALVL